MVDWLQIASSVVGSKPEILRARSSAARWYVTITWRTAAA